MRSLARSLAAFMILPFPCLSASASSELPITLTISAPHSPTVGDEVVITAVLKNISPQKIAISSGGPYIPIIHDEHGKVPPLEPGEGFWVGGGNPTFIEPGRTFTDYVAPLTRYDLVPGKYIVKLRRPLDDAGYPKGTAVESNEITITVLPRPAASELPITLTISAPLSVNVGNEIHIQAVLKNLSNQKVAFSSGDAYTVIIHDEDGKVPPLKPGLWLRAGSGGRGWLEPGETFTESAGSLNQYELAPGKYFVKVKRPLDSPRYPKDTMLESNEITITVLPKKP